MPPSTPPDPPSSVRTPVMVPCPICGTPLTGNQTVCSGRCRIERSRRKREGSDGSEIPKSGSCCGRRWTYWRSPDEKEVTSETSDGSGGHCQPDIFSLSECGTA